MSADPKQLKLELQRLREDLKSAGSWAELLNVIAQAEELARSLPPEKTCKDKTWTNLRASGLLEELSVMAILPGETWAEPDPAGVRWVFGCISALYHAFRVMDMKPEGAA